MLAKSRRNGLCEDLDLYPLELIAIRRLAPNYLDVLQFASPLIHQQKRMTIVCLLQNSYRLILAFKALAS